MTFAERFNEWLIEQGKTPLDESESEKIDAAAARAALSMDLHRDDVVRAMQDLMADYFAGESIDPRQRAKDLVVRLEAEDDRHHSADVQSEANHGDDASGAQGEDHDTA